MSNIIDHIKENGTEGLEGFYDEETIQDSIDEVEDAILSIKNQISARAHAGNQEWAGRAKSALRLYYLILKRLNRADANNKTARKARYLRMAEEVEHWKHFAYDLAVQVEDAGADVDPSEFPGDRASYEAWMDARAAA